MSKPSKPRTSQPYRAQVHVCLLEGSATANVTAALDPAFKPEQVILVYGEQNTNRVADLAAVLKPAGVKVASWPIADAWNVEHIRDRVLELLLGHDGADIALNVSGGTRPMSIAAYEIFYELGKPVFYVDPTTDRVTWLHRRDWPSFELADHIKLPAFLRAHGTVLNSQGPRSGVPKQLRQLTAALVKDVQGLARPLATLNWLAQQAEQDLVSPTLTGGQLRWQELMTLVARLQAEDVCELRNRRLHFASEEMRFFANGGWLEAHVFGLVYGLRKDIPLLQDVGRSVEIIRQDSGQAVKNELDVAFLANNRLHIIECKTKRFIQNGERADHDTPSADTLYKLDTLKGLLDGVRTRVMLVSFQPLSAWDRQRAVDLQIELCSAQQIARLRAVLRRWIVG